MLLSTITISGYCISAFATLSGSKFGSPYFNFFNNFVAKSALHGLLGGVGAQSCPIMLKTSFMVTFFVSVSQDVSIP